jgi:hypothetical protein
MAEQKPRWLKSERFGFCILSYVILAAYAEFVAITLIPFYLPIGVGILSLYAWLISTRVPETYPQPSRAIGNLFLFFILVIATFSKYYNKDMRLLDLGQLDLTEAQIYGLTKLHTTIAVSTWMLIILGVYYIVLKIRKPRDTQQEASNV